MPKFADAHCTSMRIGIYLQIFAHYLHFGAFVATAVHDDGAQSDNDNDWSDNDKYSEVPFLACP